MTTLPVGDITRVCACERVYVRLRVGVVFASRPPPATRTATELLYAEATRRGRFNR